LASSSLSVSSGLGALAAAGAGGGLAGAGAISEGATAGSGGVFGKTVQDMSSSGEGCSSGGDRSEAVRRAENRLIMRRSRSLRPYHFALIAWPTSLGLYHLAHDRLSFLPTAGVADLSAGGGATSFLSCTVMLFPDFTSSSGTPRSIASRTTR